MKRGFWRAVVVCSALLVAPVGALQQDVPIDLRPLLAARRARCGSSPRATTRSHDAFRQLRRRQRATAAVVAAGRAGWCGAQPVDVPLSPARLARLKRFDLDWQAAVRESTRRSSRAAAKADLDGLKSTIANNLFQLDAEALTMAQATPTVPFAPKLVQLVEARIRVEDVNAQKAAATLTQVTRDRRAQTHLDAGIAGAGADALSLNRTMAFARRRSRPLRAMTDRVVQLLQRLRPGVHVVDGHAVQEVDEALQDYATFLRDKVAAANLTVARRRRVAADCARPAPKFSSVPDLNEIIALPQDEMRDIVARFMAGDAAADAAAARRRRAERPRRADAAFYTRLAGGAQVARLRQALAQRAGRLPLRSSSAPRLTSARVGKTHSAGTAAQGRTTSDLRGTPRGREGLIQRSAATT